MGGKGMGGGGVLNFLEESAGPPGVAMTSEAGAGPESAWSGERRAAGGGGGRAGVRSRYRVGGAVPAGDALPA